MSDNNTFAHLGLHQQRRTHASPSIQLCYNKTDRIHTDIGATSDNRMSPGW